MAMGAITFSSETPDCMHKHLFFNLPSMYINWVENNSMIEAPFANYTKKLQMALPKNNWNNGRWIDGQTEEWKANTSGGNMCRIIVLYNSN